jgi:uncharacterized protein YkuJ
MLSLDHLDDHGRSIIEAVCERARTDVDFRALAIDDPHQAIFEETGEEVPEDFSITFFDAAGADFATVLPDVEPTGELSFDELDMVAGGTGGGDDSDDTYGGGGG